MELSHKFEIKIEEELINFFGYRDIMNKKKKFTQRFCVKYLKFMDWKIL